MKMFKLAMAKTLLGTPVPDHVLNKIKPNNLKVKLMQTWLEKVSVFEPDEAKWSKLKDTIFVSLLYDFFQNSKAMKEYYEFSNDFFLPYYHAKRIAGLFLKGQMLNAQA
jgi:hypothetical protein